MQGSFSDSSLEAFSNLLNKQKFDDFTESGGSYDFTRCVRPDGSAYGTGGQCKKGKEETARKKSPTEAQTTARKLNISKAQSVSQRNQRINSKSQKDYEAYMSKHSPKATGSAEKMNKVTADAKSYAAKRAKIHALMDDQSFAPKDPAYEKKLQSQLVALERAHMGGIVGKARGILGFAE
jgi:hypothetical protein